MTKEDRDAELVPLCLQPILAAYNQVFHLLQGLPLSRGHEHAIVPKHGTNPMSVRPYLRSQKDEKEKPIHEMIRHE